MTDRVDVAGALRGLLDHYVALVNSGDAGNWNPEEEPEVIAARTALASLPSSPAPGLTEAGVRAWMRKTGCKSIELVEDVDAHLAKLAAPGGVGAMREALEPCCMGSAANGRSGCTCNERSRRNRVLELLSDEAGWEITGRDEQSNCSVLAKEAVNAALRYADEHADLAALSLQPQQDSGLVEVPRAEWEAIQKRLANSIQFAGGQSPATCGPSGAASASTNLADKQDHAS